MSFIFFNNQDSAVQIVPPKGMVNVMEFFSADQNFRIVTDNDGAPLYSLNVPFCMNMITALRSSQGYILTQSVFGQNGYFHLQKQIDYKDAPDGVFLPKHKHDYYEMQYVFDGSAENHVEDYSDSYTTGQACLLNRNTLHSEHIREDCILVSLCFSNNYVRELFENKSIKKKVPVLYHFAEDNLGNASIYLKDYILFRPISIDPSDIRANNKLIESLFSELLVRQPGQRLMINALLVRLFSNFLDFPQKYACEHVVLDTKSEAYLFNAISRYLESYPGRPSRKALADHFNYSADHINRVVKRNCGMCLSEYNQSISLNRAEYLLKSSDKTVTQIISELGFENMNHFYGLFKKKNGLTPKQYRAKFR